MTGQSGLCKFFQSIAMDGAARRISMIGSATTDVCDKAEPKTTFLRQRVHMLRVFGLLALMTIIFTASDCLAQQHRGWFNRSARLQRAQQRALQEQVAASEHRERVSLFRSSPNWRDLDDGSSYLDPHHKFPKYIGGFHSSHFSNIGIPSGDAGFRTNGIYWPPW